MASKASMDFLQRQRIFTPQTRHRSRWASEPAQKSHTRPVIPFEGLLSSDRPNRVLTQEENQRIAYSDAVCTDCER